MERRRSPRLHPQIQATVEGAVVARRRSPRLHPQIQASEDVPGVACRRRRRRDRATSPADSASPLDDDDLLGEILLRLPPNPSSLPRASAVCKRWLGLVTDPKFIHRFRVHHRKPPLLGVFVISDYGMVFKSILDPPDRIPPQRFDPRRYSDIFGYGLLDCRHGCLLYKDWANEKVSVCNPITGQYLRLVAPPEFVKGRVKGAVLCAAGDHGHVHGGCHLSSYKVVLVSSDKQPLACVCSLGTGQWGNVISIEAPCEIYDWFTTAAILVSNVLYWLFKSSDHVHGSDCILTLDLDRQNLAVNMGPPVTNEFLHGRRQIIRAEDGVVGFTILAHPRFQMWQGNVNCQGVVTWVPWKTIEMHNILGLSLQIGEEISYVLGYDEDNNVIFLLGSRNVNAVNLKSMQSKKLYETNCINGIHHFTSFYTTGTSINGGSNGAEMLHGA